MIRKVENYIKQNNMLNEGDRVVIGVSGGADSMCLLYLLYVLVKVVDIAVTVVHIHHGIRGIEADQDEEFVRAACDRFHIGFISYHYDVKAIAMRDGLSEEEAGRMLRYQTFLDVCQKKKCNKIAIAHNKNDAAETILFHLFRGTGIRGLTGIDEVREIKAGSGSVTVIRPLLCVTREEIEHYLKEQELTYRTDSSNLTNAYSRNKIRNQILTYATNEINHNAIVHITEAAGQLKEIETYMEKNIENCYAKLVAEHGNSFRICVALLLEEDIVIQKGIIRKVLGRMSGYLKDLEAKHVDHVIIN